MIKLLAIETSCDETAAAVVCSNKQVLSHKILSQTMHKEYGGVIPEIASRGHIDHLEQIVSEAIKESSINFYELDAVAATAGPGLIGGLMVGLSMAKAIASVIKKPFIAINHLEGHALVSRMIYEIEFPFLLLIISGGHCEFLIAEDIGVYKRLGASLDDSLGETFDKVAKMLGLEYPGGPLIEKYALDGDQNKFYFPRALIKQSGCNFSFSGIKTAVKNTILQQQSLNIHDICASFQSCVADILENRINNAINIAKLLHKNIKNFVITGGVAANNFLRKKITDCAYKHKLDAYFPPHNLCTDNAIMIGWAGIERFQKGYFNSLNFPPKARWGLENIE